MPPPIAISLGTGDLPDFDLSADMSGFDPLKEAGIPLALYSEPIHPALARTREGPCCAKDGVRTAIAAFCAHDVGSRACSAWVRSQPVHLHPRIAEASACYIEGRAGGDAERAYWIWAAARHSGQKRIAVPAWNDPCTHAGWVRAFNEFKVYDLARPCFKLCHLL